MAERILGSCKKTASRFRDQNCKLLTSFEASDAVCFLLPLLDLPTCSVNILCRSFCVIAIPSEFLRVERNSGFSVHLILGSGVHSRQTSREGSRRTHPYQSPEGASSGTRVSAQGRAPKQRSRGLLITEYEFNQLYINKVWALGRHSGARSKSGSGCLQ